jgi:hypothetical protein
MGYNTNSVKINNMTNLRIKAAKDEAGQIIPENFIIDELAAGTDADGNPVKLVEKSGQHTLKSVQGNIEACSKQIAAIEAEREGCVVSFGGKLMHWATSAVLMLGAPPCQLEPWEEL